MQELRAALNLIWLDELFVGHGIVTIGFLLFLRTLTDPSQVAALVAVGLISTQVCLITAWSTWSPERLEVRAGRLMWRMGWLYLSLLLLASLNEDRHFMLLWSLPLAMGCFVLATWLPAEVVRWFRWRRIQRGELPVALPRFQFRLADVLRWTTLVCMLLAVMSRYRDEATGYLEDLGYVILIFFGVVASVPTGLVVTLLLWVALDQGTGQRGGPARDRRAYPHRLGSVLWPGQGRTRQRTLGRHLGARRHRRLRHFGDRRYSPLSRLESRPKTSAGKVGRGLSESGVIGARRTIP